MVRFFVLFSVTLALSVGAEEIDSSELPAVVVESPDHGNLDWLKRAWISTVETSGFRPNAARELRIAMRSNEPLVRTAALEAAGNLGDEASKAVPAMAGLLMDKNARVRQQAAVSLGLLGDMAEKAVPALLIALRDEDSTVRSESAHALGRIGKKHRKVVPALARALADEDEFVRWRVAEALRGYGWKAKKAATAIAKALQTPTDTSNLADPTLNFRWNLIQALRLMKGHAAVAVPVLVESLDDEAETVRLNAVEALGEIGPAAASSVPHLVSALSAGNELTRQAAATSLGKIGQKSAQPALEKALSDPDAYVRKLAAEALDRIREYRVARK